MRSVHNMQEGFNILELMITSAVIIILGFIAIPSYKDYKRNAYYSELISATAPFRIAVNKCAHNTKSLAACSAGTHGVPAAVKQPEGPIASISVMKGVITAIPNPAHGILATDTYILTPAFNAKTGDIAWKASGNGAAKKYGNGIQG